MAPGARPACPPADSVLPADARSDAAHCIHQGGAVGSWVWLRIGGLPVRSAGSAATVDPWSCFAATHNELSSRRRADLTMPLVVRQMADSYPGSRPAYDDALIQCIEECVVCFQACTACADACLAEPDIVSLIKCMRTDLDCSDACAATTNILSRRTAVDLTVVRAAVESCLASCVACAEECERHAVHHEHCRICAEVCRRCEVACRRLLAALPTSG